MGPEPKVKTLAIRERSRPRLVFTILDEFVPRIDEAVSWPLFSGVGMIRRKLSLRPFGKRAGFAV